MSTPSTQSRVYRNPIVAGTALLAGVLALAGAVYAMWARLGVLPVAVHAGLAAAAAGLFIFDHQRAPLAALAQCARRVADGDLDVHIDLGHRRDLAQLADAFNSMAAAMQQRTEDLTRKVEELTTLYEMSRALGSTLDLDALLESTLDAALRSFDIDSGYVVLRDPASGDIRLRAFRGAADAELDDRAVRASMSDWVVTQGRPLIFNPSGDETDVGNVDALTGALAAVCVPLHGSDGVIGALAVGSKDRAARFTGEDVRLLSTIANHLTIAIGNTELFASLQEAYIATVRSLAAAVDAKEPYMRGHSERVAVFARATAAELGLSHDQRTALEMAAYLHDIGKIGISEEILHKPGPLNADEAATMRHHPLIGASILRPVALPWPISPVVRHHHERYDGSGYPAGLRGEEIPMLARVLSVADAYEAMIADRPYRSSMTSDAAIDELRRCAGSHFDPRVVEALVSAVAVADPVVGYPHRDGAEVDPYEARAVFVAVVDGILLAFRRLGGPRLTSNLETGLEKWLAANEPAFKVATGHVSVEWEQLDGHEARLQSMRRVVGELSDLISEVSGPSLVDHFCGEAVEALPERLRHTARDLELQRRP